MSNTTLALIICSTLVALGALAILLAYVGFEGACTDHEEEQDIKGDDYESN